MTAPRPALLLLGPTGSGKSPLGDTLAARGLAGRRCLHFDFGAALRRATASDRSDRSDLSEADRVFIRRVLEEGALLEPEDFPVAERVLKAFLARNDACRPPRPRNPVAEAEGRGRLARDSETLLILNGLPRHVQQAEAMADVAEVRLVVELRCPPETILERIRGNTGGDRTGRVDDDGTMVAKKLALYAEQTVPLLDYYRRHGIPVLPLDVGPETRAETLRRRIEEASPASSFQRP